MGVQLKNENKLEEMADILEEFHKYVPNHASEGNIVLPDGHTRNFDNTLFHKLLVGGDQLTVARVRGATALRSALSKSIHHLACVTPVVEDWHARMTLMKVNTQTACGVKVCSLLASTTAQLILNEEAGYKSAFCRHNFSRFAAWSSKWSSSRKLLSHNLHCG